MELTFLNHLIDTLYEIRVLLVLHACAVRRAAFPCFLARCIVG